MRTLESIKLALIQINQPWIFSNSNCVTRNLTVQDREQPVHNIATVQPEAIKHTERPKYDSHIQRFIDHRKKAVMRSLNGVWSEAKVIGRVVTRWLAWRVVLPLSIISSFWIPAASPANLPL